jgi:hypothetical protein
MAFSTATSTLEPKVGTPPRTQPLAHETPFLPPEALYSSASLRRRLGALVPRAIAEMPQTTASVWKRLVFSRTAAPGSPLLGPVSDMKSIAYWAMPNAWLLSAGRWVCVERLTLLAIGVAAGMKSFSWKSIGVQKGGGNDRPHGGQNRRLPRPNARSYYPAVS